MKKTIISVALLSATLLSIPLQAEEPAAEDRFENLMYTYTVTINGKPYKFILDAGISETIIDETLAEQLGGNIKYQDYPPRLKMTEYNNTDENVLGFIKSPEMKIGNHNIYLDVLQVSDLSDVYKNRGSHIDGVLGMNAINQYIWEFDNANKTNYLHPFSDTQIEKTFSFCTPYGSNGFSPIIYIAKNNEHIPFALVFGKNFSLINKEDINILKLKKEDFTLNESQDKPAYYYMDNFTFASQQVKGDHFLENDHYMSFFGTTFLNRFDKILFNPLTQTICFNHFNTENAPKIYRRLTILIENDHIEITENDEKALNKLGLKNGDIIVSVNNKKYPTDQITLARKAITYSKNLTLEVKRDGKIIPVTIKQ